MQLVYRSQMLHFGVQPKPAIQTDQAVSWRYQVADCSSRLNHEPRLITAPKYYCPQAIKWRFQSVVNG